MATGRQIITAALRKLNAASANSEPTAEDINLGLETLNALIDSKSNEFLNTHTIKQQIFPLEAGKLQYSVGPTGDWVTPRPIRVEKIKLLMSAVMPDPITPQTILHPFQSTMLYWDSYRAFLPDCQVTLTNGFDTSGVVTPPGAIFYNQTGVVPTGEKQGVFLGTPNTAVRGNTAFGNNVSPQNLVWEYFIFADYPQSVGFTPTGTFNPLNGTGGTSAFYKSTGEISGRGVAAEPYGFGDVIGCIYTFQSLPTGSVAFFKNGIYQASATINQLEGHVFAGRTI